MGNPIYIANTPMSDALVALLVRDWELTLADRTGTSILADPVLASGFENWGAFGALGTKKLAIGYGATKMSQTNEGVDLTVETLGDSSANLTASRYGFARQISDRARLYDAWGITEWRQWLMDCEWGWGQTVVNVLAALFPSISATGGNTGGAATWAKVLNDIGTLKIAKVPGPFTLVTRPKDWQNVAKDALALGGAVAQDPETMQYMQMAGYGYQGMYLHGQLRVYTTDELDTSGGDTVSAMFGRGCFRWTASSYPASSSAKVLMRTPTWQSEVDREVLKSDDVVANTSEIGASIFLNAAGIKCLYLT